LALLSPRLFLRLSEQRVWLLRLRGGLPHVSQQDVLEREERPVVALRRDRGRVVRQMPQQHMNATQRQPASTVGVPPVPQVNAVEPQQVRLHLAAPCAEQAEEAR